MRKIIVDLYKEITTRLTSHRWWLRSSEIYVHRLTPLFFLLAAIIYYWSGNSISSGLRQPWQVVIYLGLIFALLYWWISKNTHIRWVALFFPTTEFVHILLGYIGAVIFTYLYSRYLPSGEQYYSTWPLLIYPLMFHSMSQLGTTPWPLICLVVCFSITGSIEAQRFGWQILIHSSAWVLVVGSLVHYFSRRIIVIEKRTVILAKIANELMGIPLSDEYYQKVVELVGVQMDFPVVHLLIVKPGDEENLTVRAGYGKSEAVWRKVIVPFGRSVTGMAASRRSTCRVDDVENCSFYYPAEGYDDIRSEISTPIFSDGNKLFGVLDVQSNVVGMFTLEDEQTLTVLAEAIGIALAQEGATLRIQKAVDDTWEEMSQFQTEHEIFRWVAEFISVELKPDLVSCHSLIIGTGHPKEPPYLWPEEDEPGTGVGYIDRAEVLNYVRNKTNAVTNMVVLWETYIQSDAKNDKLINPTLAKPSLIHKSSFVEREGIVSIAFVPIGTEDNRLGAIFINYRRRHVFNKVEVSVLKALAHAAAPHLLRVRKIWQIYEGFDRPELNIHELITHHASTLKESVLDLLRDSKNEIQRREKLNDILVEIDRGTRKFLLAASGEPVYNRSSLLGENLISVSRLLTRASKYSINYFVEVTERVEDLNAEAKLVLCRIAAEAMGNTARHSDATVCKINIFYELGKLVLEINQDGNGFSLHNVQQGRYGIFHLLVLARQHMDATWYWLPEENTYKTGLRVVFPALPMREELFS